jgi:hypothetical protein
MDTEDWCGLVVRTPSRLRFGLVVGVFTEGPHAGRLRVHGAYRLGGGTQAAWQGTLVRGRDKVPTDGQEKSPPLV